MAITIPRFFVGRYLKNAKITPLTLSSAGVATKGTAYDLATSFVADSIRFSDTAETEEISAANSVMRNHVPLKDDFDVEINEILAPSGTGLALNCWVGVDFFLVEVICSPDGGTTNYIVQAVAVRAGLTHEFVEGKSVLQLTGKAAGLPIFYGLPGATLAY